VSNELGFRTSEFHSAEIPIRFASPTKKTGQSNVRGQNPPVSLTTTYSQSEPKPFGGVDWLCRINLKMVVLD
jgi:hypothetical protein